MRRRHGEAARPAERQERGIGFLDAPVSGSTAPARAGTLTTLVGGSAEDLERARPALEAMTRAQHHLGGVGSGAIMKLALNTAIAVANESISELLVLCERAGLERPAAYAALADSALASPFVQYKQAAFLHPDDEPVAFTPLLMLKGLTLADALASEVGAELPAVDAARGVLERTVAAGRGDEDLVRVAGRAAGRRRPVSTPQIVIHGASGAAPPGRLPALPEPSEVFAS